jgi:hypothetical protein
MCVLGLTTEGFPSAPYYTLFGLVRDQVGQVVTAEQASLILLVDGEEVARTPVVSGVRLEQNYELNIRLDSNRGATRLYDPAAVVAGGVYSLRVEINGVDFYPIEAAGELRAGVGGERVRLDLNLGEDTDGDGLPDVWEEWQVYQAGYMPNANGDWPIELIDREGDFDGDGQSNFLEYLAGTFAGDAAERFDLQILSQDGTGVALAFYAITGKTYTIERSEDMETWSLVGVALTPGGTEADILTATSVGILDVYAQAPPGGERGFYRLTVR